MDADQGRCLPSRCSERRSLSRFLSAVAVRAVRSGRTKDLEIIVLRQQPNLGPTAHHRRTQPSLRLRRVTNPQPARRRPAPNRSDATWTQFLRSQAAVACDFGTVGTALLRRYYLLFFIDITTLNQPRSTIRHPHPSGSQTPLDKREDIFLF